MSGFWTSLFLPDEGGFTYESALLVGGQDGGKALSRCSLLAIKACCALVRLCAAAFVASSNHKTITWEEAFLGKGLCDPG